jgi:hypothetical protein
MEKINQGQKITVEHLDGYSWKNKISNYSFLIFLTFLLFKSSDDSEISFFTSILFFIFWVGVVIFTVYYTNVPEKFHNKQYTIYFFKDYFLLENFDKSIGNHELYFNSITRIYSQKKGFITIDIIDPMFCLFEKNGIKNLKLDEFYINNTNELVEYLNTYIEKYDGFQID